MADLKRLQEHSRDPAKADLGGLRQTMAIHSVNVGRPPAEQQTVRRRGPERTGKSAKNSRQVGSNAKTRTRDGPGSPSQQMGGDGVRDPSPAAATVYLSTQIRIRRNVELLVEYHLNKDGPNIGDSSKAQNTHDISS